MLRFCLRASVVVPPLGLRPAQRLLAGLAAGLLVVLGLGGLAAAQAPAEPTREVATGVDPDLAAQRALGITRQTRSPFCPGRTLDDCPSPRAEEWRMDIREWTDEGVPSEEIQRRLQERVPGFQLWPSESLGAWLLPLAIGLGALPLIFIVRRWRKREPDVAETDAATDAASRDALDERLDDELARLE